MSDQSLSETGATVNNQVLLALGELKGQMLSISAFLQGHSERMDRQDKRQDDLEDTARLNREHAEAELTRAKASLDERLRKAEQKINYWAGGLAVLFFLIEAALKLKLFEGSH